MSVPDSLKYTDTHEWVKPEADGTVTVGITDHAQQQLGDVVFLELPESGRTVARGDECGVIESVKAASDLYAPVSGEIIASNTALTEAPETVNASPYEAWLFRIKLKDAAELDNLLDGAAYQKVADAG